MHQVKRGVEGMFRSVPLLRRPRRYASSGGKVTDSSSTVKTIKGSQPTVSASTATSPQINPDATSDDKPQRARIPLDVPLPGLQNPSFSTAERKTYETQVTQLDSGLRVASQPRPGRYCTIGVAVQSGARFEKPFVKGVSHLIEKLGFLTSDGYPDKMSIVQEMEAYGAICDSQSSRDTTVYAISLQVSGLEKMMRLLGDAVFRPRLTDEELTGARQNILYELEDLQLRPEKETVILEMMHEAAWNNNTLGYHRLCQADSIETVTREEILKFMKTNYTPERMVVSAVGVDHSELVDLSKEYFKVDNATWNLEGIPAVEPDHGALAVYTGGEIRIEQDFTQFNAGPLPVPKLAHMGLGLQSVSHKDPLFITACVLNIMMEGEALSVPGALAKECTLDCIPIKHWVYNATAYNNSYNDGGMFCIYASAPPEYLKTLTETLMQEFHRMADPVDPQEFNRAKRQLQSMLLMNLESRPVLFEDIGRQVLAHGHYKPPAEYIQLIEQVTPDDIKELAQRMLTSRPSLAALGTLDRLPKYDEIITAGKTGDVLRMPHVKGIFRR
ncbi:Mitochondrial-processing peptidase subunit alpha [Orchesella cincta]|uniref:Alpha-MPP n=1 Tax=Orchesella cincta TaxID=48709 RepID=A0A1D2NB76_ORCCI|nr:Mitochondrial-processing peptidase subunit alpha [Orchesella cincta]